MALKPYQQTMYADTTADLTPLIANDGQVARILDLGISATYSSSIPGWVPGGTVTTIRSTVSVNAKNTGATLLYTLPATAFYFYPIGIIMRAVTVAGTGTNPIASIGSNATSYNNIGNAGLLSTLMSTLGTSSGVPINATFSPPLAGGTTIYVNVTTAAILFTNYVVKFDILGFYDTASS